MAPKRKADRTEEPVQAGRPQKDPELTEGARKTLGIKDGQS